MRDIQAVARILYGANMMARMMWHDAEFCRAAERLLRQGYTPRETARRMR